MWYGSDQEQAAWAELFRHFLDAGVDPFEVLRWVGAADVDSLEVLDLTDDAVLKSLGIVADDLVGDELHPHPGRGRRGPGCRLRRTARSPLRFCLVGQR